MAANALPIPPSPVDSSKIRLTRRYTDLVGRPLNGQVTIVGQEITQEGISVVVPTSTVVPLRNGVIDVQLPAGTYSLTAELYSLDRVTSTHSESVTLTRSST